MQIKASFCKKKYRHIALGQCWNQVIRLTVGISWKKHISHNGTVWDKAGIGGNQPLPNMGPFWVQFGGSQPHHLGILWLWENHNTQSQPVWG